MADRSGMARQREGEAVPEAADRLRHFCSAILQLFDGSAGGPALAAELSQVIGTATQAVAAGLRADLRSCEAAIEQLAVVARSRYVQPAGDLAGLRAELERTREKGLRLLEALESLRATGSATLPAAVSPVADWTPALSSGRLTSKGEEDAGPDPARVFRPAVKSQRPQTEPDVRRSLPAASETAIHDVTSTLPELPACTRGRASDLRPESTNTQPAAVDKAAVDKAAVDKAAGHGKAADDRMEVSCPRCGCAGLIGWGRLNKVIKCPTCGKHFSVRPNGVTTEVIRTPDGRWVESRARQPAPQGRTGRRLLAALSLAAVLVPAASALAWRANRGPSHAGETELPRELQPRAEIFAKAWLRNDLPLMRRLTVPTHDRILYSWFTRHRPPAPPDGPPTDVRVEVKPTPAAGGMTLVRSRVSGNGLLTEHGPLELALHWEEHDGIWYCVPPNK